MNYKGKREEKQRLKKLYDETKNNYCAGAYPNNKRKGYITRFSPSKTPGYTKWLRRHGNKKVRHNKEPLQNGGYCKLYDYWSWLY